MQNLLTELRQTLDHGGVSAGLRYLNERVPHRFTAVYRLVDGTMQNVGFFDKHGEIPPDALLAVPLTSSFCQFVLRDGQFASGATGHDARLDGHPYPGVVNSYVGLPLTRGGDDLRGTLCHFDFDAIDVPDDEFEFLRKAALLLPNYLAL